MSEAAEAIDDIADFDDEESGPASASMRTGDRVFMVTGFLLATAAAFFPWYVFFNQESFGIAPMGYAESRALTQLPGRTVVNASPLAIPDAADAVSERSAFDPITTATVSGAGETGKAGAEPVPVAADPAQPFPGKPRYRLLHVANGRALIEDKSGMYIVRIGSVLPDNSRLATLEKRDGNWVIITSNGEVIRR